MGVSVREIERRLEVGRLHRLHRGVYAVGHKVLSREARWMAAVLVCGEGAVLSHRSAAALWGIRSYSGGPIHITSPSKTRSQDTIRRHCARLPADEVTKYEEIPVTTVPRTLFDLASEATPQSVESALRQCEYLRLYDPLSLWDLLERYPRHRGNRAVRAALASLGRNWWRDAKQARGPLPRLPRRPSPAPTAVERLDSARWPPLPSRLPLASRQANSRARLVAGARHPLGIPIGQVPSPPP